MILEVKGTYTYNTAQGFLSPAGKQLREVNVEAAVHSKKQAREEFERFLEATVLPELTSYEQRKAEEAVHNA
jgi:hypothetical protein